MNNCIRVIQNMLRDMTFTKEFTDEYCKSILKQCNLRDLDAPDDEQDTFKKLPKIPSLFLPVRSGDEELIIAPDMPYLGSSIVNDESISIKDSEIDLSIESSDTKEDASETSKKKTKRSKRKAK